MHTLVEKHYNLERNMRKVQQKRKDTTSESRKCGERSEKLEELKKHKETKCSDAILEQAENLDTHKSSAHEKFEWEECDKEFRYAAVLEKHIEAVHEDVKLFCHYFNNDKECPYMMKSEFIFKRQCQVITDLVFRYDMIIFVRKISLKIRYENVVWENIISDMI